MQWRLVELSHNSCYRAERDTSAHKRHQLQYSDWALIYQFIITHKVLAFLHAFIIITSRKRPQEHLALAGKERYCFCCQRWGLAMFFSGGYKDKEWGRVLTHVPV